MLFDADAEMLDSEISRRFDFVYSDSELCSLPLKVTASELSHIKSGKSFEKKLSKPKFLSDCGLTAAQKGTAMHKFLQFANFDLARRDLALEVQRLTGIRLTQSEAESLDLYKLNTFLQSQIITDAINYPSYREYRFTVDIPASLTELTDNDRTMLVLQGAVDLIIVKNGKLTVVDYKTDRVKDVNELIPRYEKQLTLYRSAVSRCFELPVDRCLIYSVYLGEYIEVL